MNVDGFRFGILDGIVNSRISPSVLPRVGSLTAAATGADSYWVGDHLNSFLPRSIATPEYLGVAAKLVPKIDAVLEPWTMLGHLAARNRVRRLRLGVCVTDAGRRNPAVTAQAAATLHLLTRGRAMLGIGVGEREGNEPYGVEWTKPVARLEEAVATIRTLWDSAGEPVSRDSPYFPLKKLYLIFRHTGGNGQRSGSQPTGRGCCGSPDAMPTPGFPSLSVDPLTTPVHSQLYALRRLTPIVTPCR